MRALTSRSRLTDNENEVTVRVSSVDAGTTVELELTDCDRCQEEDQNGTALSINSNHSDFPNDGVLEVRLTLNCEDQDRVKVRVVQDGDPAVTVEVTCNPEGNIVIGNSADDDDSVDFDFEISGILPAAKTSLSRITMR